MISEEQKKKYEEAANVLYPEDRFISHIRKSFIKGCEHAHSEGFNQGWNEAIEKAIKISENRQDESTDNAEYLGHFKVIEELKRLKR